MKTKLQGTKQLGASECITRSPEPGYLYPGFLGFGVLAGKISPGVMVMAPDLTQFPRRYPWLRLKLNGSINFPCLKMFFTSCL